MIYVIIAAAIAALLALGTIQVQHANNAKLKSEVTMRTTERDTALAANKSLADSIGEATKECTKVKEAHEAQLAKDRKRQMASKAIVAKASVRTDAPKVAELERVLAPPILLSSAETQCKAAESILLDLAKEMNQ